MNITNYKIYFYPLKLLAFELEALKPTLIDVKYAITLHISLIMCDCSCL